MSAANTPTKEVKELKDMIGFEQDILNMQMLYENQSLTGTYECIFPLSLSVGITLDNHDNLAELNIKPTSILYLSIQMMILNIW